jgi:hypothetical protein
MLTIDTFLSQVRETDWMVRAACKHLDTNLFYPERGDNESVTIAKEVCSTCPVSEQCGEYGIPEVYGFWGGVSPMKRRRERVRRRRGLDPINLVAANNHAEA